MKESTKKPTALDIHHEIEKTLHDEQHLRTHRDNLVNSLREKEKVITDEIIAKLIENGNHKSNLRVSTSITGSNVFVSVRNWNYNVEYRSGELLITQRESITDQIRLSEMNMVFELILGVIEKEELK